MSNTYYTREQIKSRFIVEHGLDPRSTYPKCDLCSKKAMQGIHGTVQIGRWWAHESCVTDPDIQGLHSTKLPALDYSPVADRPTVHEQLMAMRAKLHDWTLDALARLKATAEQRGSILLRDSSTTEYL